MGTQHTNHEPTKTLGPQAARLITQLHQRGRTVFTHAEVEAITALKAKSARNLMTGLVNRGLATRLEPGLFILVPFELGLEREYLGNPYVVARELVDTPDYYVSHASAMELHRMVTQPQLAVFVTSPKAVRPRTVLGTEFRFVRCKRQDLFGIVDHWVTKTERVRVSDLERTVIDGLKQPEHCGGFTEVAKGYWIRRDAIATSALVDHALRLGVGAVVRRLGFLLETFEAISGDEIERLRTVLTATYALLDPLLPAEGPYQARWRLRVNVEPEELRTLVKT
ncbi:MAG: transcriptional regulator [Planctomycetes bacterium]|nr:transcriptional regulator [Planctomycetota bacterium]